MINTYSGDNAKVKGRKCMVFPDRKNPSSGQGSRYIWGIIRFASNNIITVEITKSNFTDWKKDEWYRFPPHQVWAYQEEQKKVVQLELFV